MDLGGVDCEAGRGVEGCEGGASRGSVMRDTGMDVWTVRSWCLVGGCWHTWQRGAYGWIPGGSILFEGVWVSMHYYFALFEELACIICIRGVVKSKAKGSVLACNALALTEAQNYVKQTGRTPSRFMAISRMSDKTIVSLYDSYQMMQTSTWSNEIMNAQIFPALCADAS